MKNMQLLLWAGLLLALFTRPTIGGVIYSQPVTFTSNGATMSDFDPSVVWGNHYQFASDDFTLSVSATITEIRWWGLYQKDNPVVNIQPPVSDTLPSSNFTIRFFNNNGGVPGTVELELNSLGNCSRTQKLVTGSGGSLHYFEYNCVLPQTFQANANETYWLFIADSTGSFPDDIFWSWLKSETPEWAYSFQPGGLTGWTRYSGTTGMSFELVPEPATLGLLAMGGLAMLRRRQRA